MTTAQKKNNTCVNVNTTKIYSEREHVLFPFRVTLGSYLRRPDSLPLVPTEELRLTTRRSTSFLSSTPLEGPFTGTDFTPGAPQGPAQETRRNTFESGGKISIL